MLASFGIPIATHKTIATQLKKSSTDIYSQYFILNNRLGKSVRDGYNYL